jgi:release factor glutamine methyltransferase
MRNVLPSDEAGAFTARPSVGEARTIGALLTALTAMLERSHVPLASDEARDIVAAMLDVPRFWPSTNRGVQLDAQVAADAAGAAGRRARGAPFAYAVGRAAFRHLTLDVDERVLIPRQETEVLVDLVLEEAGRGGTVVDIGTGSGAIALALATEGAFDHVIGTDVSVGALAVAARNMQLLARALRTPVELRQGSLLAPVSDVRARVVVSNPPYISFHEMDELPASVRDWEPPLALFSAHDGMAATSAIVRGAGTILEVGGLLALEVDTRRASVVAECVATDGRYQSVRVALDLAGRERFVLARRR